MTNVTKYVSWHCGDWLKRSCPAGDTERTTCPRFSRAEGGSGSSGSGQAVEGGASNAISRRGRCPSPFKAGGFPQLGPISPSGGEAPHPATLTPSCGVATIPVMLADWKGGSSVARRRATVANPSSPQIRSLSIDCINYHFTPPPLFVSILRVFLVLPPILRSLELIKWIIQEVLSERSSFLNFGQKTNIPTSRACSDHYFLDHVVISGSLLQEEECYNT